MNTDPGGVFLVVFDPSMNELWAAKTGLCIDLYWPSSLTACSQKGRTQLKIQPQGPYSQQIIFFVTYESVQKARVLHNIRLQRLSNVKSSNLLVQVVNYDEKEVPFIGKNKGPYSQHFIFLQITNEPIKLDCLILAELYRLL